MMATATKTKDRVRIKLRDGREFMYDSGCREVMGVHQTNRQNQYPSSYNVGDYLVKHNSHGEEVLCQIMRIELIEG